MTQLYCRVVLPAQNVEPLTYHFKQEIELELGSAVIVDLRNRKVLGYVIEIFDVKPPYKTKSIVSVLNKIYWLSKDSVYLANWISRFYINSLGLVFDLFIPKGLRLKNGKIEYKEKKRKFIRVADKSKVKEKDKEIVEQLESLSPILLSNIDLLGFSSYKINRLVKEGVLEKFEAQVARDIKKPNIESKLENIPLNSSQQKVYRNIVENIGDNFYLHGVTGSGKTRVFVHLTNYFFKKGKSILILVPEVGLTPQIYKEFYSIFGDETIYFHSKMNNSERHEVWLGVKSGRYRVVVGTRSSVFLPFKDLALIIVDEEHDNSYIQDDSSPYYNAKMVALMIAKKISILFASATPSIDLYYQIVQKKLKLLTLLERATKVTPPNVVMVDLKKEKIVDSFFSNITLSKIKTELDKNKKVVVYFNRRGYFTLTVCSSCGATFQCPSCSRNMTYHKSEESYKCHLCGYQTSQKPVCQCGGEFVEKGVGIQQVEEMLSKFFPNNKIFRMDTDVVSKTKLGHEKVLDEFRKTDASILLGTQMVTKGHDIDGVSLVVVVLADMGMGVMDYRTDERVFQLLTQVIGRAGRGNEQGTAIIQTYNIDNEIFDYVLKGDYQHFFNYTMRLREGFGYPPYIYHSLLVFKNRDVNVLEKDVAKVYEYINKKGFDSTQPYAPQIDKRENFYFRNIIVKHKDRVVLTNFMWSLRTKFKKINSRLYIKIDPNFVT